MNQATLYRLLAEKEDLSEIPQGNWRRAAVLALFLPGLEGEEILFTRRTDTVLDHKGQVSFPGGAVEPGDSSLEATALREAWEEIGLEPDGVEILGRSRDLFTNTGWWITPVIGWYKVPSVFLLNPAEVTRVFTIPVTWLAQSANWEKRMFIKDGRMRENVIFYNEYQGELLWGVTAHMIHDLLRKINLIV